MTKYFIIAGIRAELDTDSQISAVREFINSLPDSVVEIRIDKALKSNWQKLEDEEED